MRFSPPSPPSEQGVDSTADGRDQLEVAAEHRHQDQAAEGSEIIQTSLSLVWIQFQKKIKIVVLISIVQLVCLFWETPYHSLALLPV